MSYKCDNCGAVERGKQNKVVSVIRNVRYNKFFNRFDKRSGKKIPKFISSFDGHEIVKEERLCVECYDKQKELAPRVENRFKEVKFFETKKQSNTDERRNYATVEDSGC